jgi:60 kDa SS-A/Ro ribonucleoprotein
MANRSLFASSGSTATLAPVADARNSEGARAYKMSDEHTLAQLVVTSCFNQTFYTTAKEQLDSVKKLAASCSTEFVAKAALYAFEQAKMRDTAVFLLATLTTRGSEGIRLFERIFPRVVVNVGMLRNFVQVIRSGQVGRKSFGTAPKRILRNWLASKDAAWMFSGSLGNDPSFADVVKMVRPKPESDMKKAFYAYMIGRPHDINHLPQNVANFEMFKLAKSKGIEFKTPDVPFQMLSSLSLTRSEWRDVARNMRWKGLQMNLETLGRHGVYDDPAMVREIAGRIRDADEIRKANMFPYQLMTAYKYTPNVPTEIRNALQEAMEIATENVPAFSQDVAFCLDVSRSMTDLPITGTRTGSTTKTLCVEVASLMAATVLRRNKNAMFLPFDLTVHANHGINPFDSVVTNAQKMSKLGGGGTDCAGPLRVLNGLVDNRKKPKLIIMASDNESWYLNGGTWHNYYWRTHGPSMGVHTKPTTVAEEWVKYRRAVPDARLVCIDLVPSTTTQAKDTDRVLNIGGWSDSVWDVITKFANGEHENFVATINSVSL